MPINPQDKTTLQKFTLVAKKIIYEPARMKAFMKMLGSKEGAVQAVHTVIAAIEQFKPIPPQIKALLGVNVYLIMVDVAQEVTNLQPDPQIIKEVVGMIMAEAGGQPPTGPSEPGMLAQMQEQGEPPGDPTTPDDMPEHEGAEAPEMEQMEGAEEDPPQDPRAGMLSRMQRRGAMA